MRRQEEGFTLIELVIVIVILGILAAVAIPQYFDMTNDAKDAARTGGKSAVASAVAITAARKKATFTPADVASNLPGSTCQSGGIRISSGGTDFVTVQLIDSSAALVATCTAATVAGVGTALYAST